VVNVVWRKKALGQLRQIFYYISEDSLESAKQVINNILNTVERLPENPEKFPPDKYKLKNDGSFRAFELYSYRVAYQITSKEIRILRVRHIRMEPLNF
jgi:plasmid stabilization system protein ParE